MSLPARENQEPTTAASLRALWSPVLAITTCHGTVQNGQIAVAGLNASILSDAPRVILELWKSNYTHDLVLASGICVLHLLPDGPGAALARSLDLVRRLGLRSGRDGPKLDGLAWQVGVTGAPILADALSAVELRIVRTLDADEATVFLTDVVGGVALATGTPLTMRALRTALPAEDLAAWDAQNIAQRARARAMRGFA